MVAMSKPKFHSKHRKHSPEWLYDLRVWLGDGDGEPISLRDVAPTVGATYAAWSYWESGKPIKECHRILLGMLADGTLRLKK